VEETHIKVQQPLSLESDLADRIEVEPIATEPDRPPGQAELLTEELPKKIDPPKWAISEPIVLLEKVKVESLNI
jgi:hypothetical protein